MSKDSTIGCRLNVRIDNKGDNTFTFTYISGAGWTRD